jgi:hypothetical protein
MRAGLRSGPGELHIQRVAGPRNDLDFTGFACEVRKTNLGVGGDQAEVQTRSAPRNHLYLVVNLGRNSA